MFLFARRYECTEELGSGQFGRVLRALDHHLGREVALKLLIRGNSIELAVREAQVLTALESPHIVRVFNADIYQDVPFLATDVAPLKSCEDHMDKYGVRPELAVRWTRQMLIGLGVCHTRGLIHGDIKPSNAFLYQPDEARLGDFGVARMMDQAGRARARGDPRIQPPEVLRTGISTPRSDIYGAGVLLYTLLTGKYPYTSTDPAQLRKDILQGRKAPLRDAAPHVGRGLAQRVAKAMSHNPGDRYASATEMHAALGSLPRRSGAWQRITPHVGHNQCWENEGTSTPLQVCVLGSQRPYDVEVRRRTGSQSRLRRHCATCPNNRALLVHLRRTFEALT